MDSFSTREDRTSWTKVPESYLNVLVCPFSKKTFKTLGMKGTQESKEEKGDAISFLFPLTWTPSANRTREGLLFSLAFLAAVKRDDFRIEGLLDEAVIRWAGWQTVIWRLCLHVLTNSMTRSRGALDTSSPLMSKIWSSLWSFPSLGPPSLTNLTMTGFSDPATNPNPISGCLSKTTVLRIGSKDVAVTSGCWLLWQ